MTGPSFTDSDALHVLRREKEVGDSMRMWKHKWRCRYLLAPCSYDIVRETQMVHFGTGGVHDRCELDEVLTGKNTCRHVDNQLPDTNGRRSPKDARGCVTRFESIEKD